MTAMINCQRVWGTKIVAAADWPAFPLITCGSHKGIDSVRCASAERRGNYVLEKISGSTPVVVGNSPENMYHLWATRGSTWFNYMKQLGHKTYQRNLVNIQWKTPNSMTLDSSGNSIATNPGKTHDFI